MMRIAQSRQKVYAEHRHRPLEFSIGDKVFLKISPIKEILHINRKSKLNLRFVRLFQILERVGWVAYRLDLPP